MDARSDIYSLGIVFFEMLTDKVPYDAEETFAVGLKHINDPVPRLPGHVSDCQPLIDAMLAKESDHRYPDCKALEQDILRLEQGHKPLGTGSRSRSVMPESVVGRSTGPIKTIMFGALAALVAAACVYFYMEKNRFVIPRGGGSVQAKLTSPVSVPAPELVPVPPRPKVQPLKTSVPPPQLLGSLKVTTTLEGDAVTPDGTDKGQSLLEIKGLTLESPTVRAALTDHSDTHLSLKSRPSGADIFVHGHYKGKAPLEINDISPGSYTVKARLAQHQAQERQVQVTQGRSTYVMFTLAPIKAKCRLYITTSPKDCRIRILNIAPVFYNGIELNPGRYQLEMSRSGYKTKTHWVNLSQGHDMDLNVALDKKEDTLGVIQKPSVALKKGGQGPKAPQFHTVQKGESMWNISQKYKTTVATIRKLNNLSPEDKIYPGSNILVPSIAPKKGEQGLKARQFHTVQKGETMWDISQKYKTTVATIRKLNNLSPEDKIYPGSNILVPSIAPKKGEQGLKARQFHTVQKGETMWDISQKYKTTVATIRKLNNLSPEDKIYPGSNLLVH